MGRPAVRERTVCESCELPYYADGEGCPYCEGSVATDVRDPKRNRDDEPGFVFESTEPDENASAGGDGDDSDGLVGRLKRTLGL